MSARCPTCGIDRERLAELLECAAAELRDEAAPRTSPRSELARHISILAERANNLGIDVPPQGLSEKNAAEVANVHIDTIRRWRKEGRGTDWKLQRPPYRWTLEVLARARMDAD